MPPVPPVSSVRGHRRAERAGRPLSRGLSPPLSGRFPYPSARSRPWKGRRGKRGLPGVGSGVLRGGDHLPLPPRASPWKPLRLHIKGPGGSARVPGQGPARDPPAALALSGVGRSPPDRPSPASSVGGQELTLEVTAWKSRSSSFSTLTRGSQIGEGWP